MLLSAQKNELPKDETQLTLCPGKHTTAALLFQLFYPQTTQVGHVVFSEIMPKLKSSQADFGVCIHEGRFTWQKEGLGLVEDLGTRWENETKSPLPLGGLIARTSLSPDTIATVQNVIHDSLLFALDDHSSALPTMRKHAQEFNDEVLMKHVDLYVNDWTKDLGTIGRNALNTLSDRARKIGLIPSDGGRLNVFDL